jgi:hypothetical protein
MRRPSDVPPLSGETGSTLFDLFGPNAVASMRRRLGEGRFITGENLASIIAANPQTVGSEHLRAHLQRVLRGEVKKPNGRPSLAVSERQTQRRSWSFAEYEQSLGSGEPVLGDELAALIEANPSAVAPEFLRDYLCAFDEVKQKRGRKAADSRTVVLLRQTLADVDYERYLAWLKKRKKRHSLRGWGCGAAAPRRKACSTASLRGNPPELS